MDSLEEMERIDAEDDEEDDLLAKVKDRACGTTACRICGTYRACGASDSASSTLNPALASALTRGPFSPCTALDSVYQCPQLLKGYIKILLLANIRSS